MQRADLQVVDILATPALEMIVMAHAGALVASLPIREDHGLDALRLQQQIQCPINRRDPQTPERGLRPLQDLLNGDGTPGLSDGLEDGIALARMTLAERGRHTSNLRNH